MAATAKSKLSVTMAEKADIHELYEKSVQAVDVEAEFLRDTYRALRGREALSLREDFCGTASLACEWVRTGTRRHAIGVDLDPDVLDWGRRHRVARLPETARARVKLLNDDVRSVSTQAVDIVGAFNFSYFCFKARDEMRAYFVSVREALNRDGVFFLDAFGGPDASDLTKEKAKIDGFTYVWEQAEFEPVTGRILCHIHFKFPDGSKIKRAFTYDWRLVDAPRASRAAHGSGLQAGSSVLGGGRWRGRRQRRVHGARDGRRRLGVDRISRRGEVSDAGRTRA